MATAAERVRDRLRPNGTVDTARFNAVSNSLHEDLTELLADYRAMCEFAGETALALYKLGQPATRNEGNI
jgi:hypothetical protein